MGQKCCGSSARKATQPANQPVQTEVPPLKRSVPSPSNGYMWEVNSSTGAASYECMDDRSSKSSSMNHVLMTKKVVIKRNLSGTKCINNYEILDEVGRGAYGKVKLALDLNTHLLFAMKVINKAKLSRISWHGRSALDNIRREVAVLQRLRHPCIIRLHEVIDDPDSDKMYLIMDYCGRGAVTRLCPKTKRVLTEKDENKGFELGRWISDIGCDERDEVQTNGCTTCSRSPLIAPSPTPDDHDTCPRSPQANETAVRSPQLTTDYASLRSPHLASADDENGLSPATSENRERTTPVVPLLQCLPSHSGAVYDRASFGSSFGGTTVSSPHSLSSTQYPENNAMLKAEADHRGPLSPTSETCSANGGEHMNSTLVLDDEPHQGLSEGEGIFQDDDVFPGINVEPPTPAPCRPGGRRDLHAAKKQQQQQHHQHHHDQHPHEHQGQQLDVQLQPLPPTPPTVSRQGSGLAPNSDHAWVTPHALFRSVAEALEYCHSVGVVHRDIKPSNMLVDDDGNVKLSDFGAATLFSEEGLPLMGTEKLPVDATEALKPPLATLTPSVSPNSTFKRRRAGSRDRPCTPPALSSSPRQSPRHSPSRSASIGSPVSSTPTPNKSPRSIEISLSKRERSFFNALSYRNNEGTPAFWPPEVFDPNVPPSLQQGRCIDSWQFGVTLYLLFVGNLPFRGSNQRELREAVCTNPVNTPPGLGPSTERVIKSLLSKMSADRPTLTEVLQDELFWGELEGIGNPPAAPADTLWTFDNSAPFSSWHVP